VILKLQRQPPQTGACPSKWCLIGGMAPDWIPEFHSGMLKTNVSFEKNQATDAELPNFVLQNTELQY
jgi:hypothetical protein